MNWMLLVVLLSLVIGVMVLPRLLPAPRSRERIETTSDRADVVGLEEKGAEWSFPWLPVLAATALVAALLVATPAYQDYSGRSQTTAMLAELPSARISIEEALAQTNSEPARIVLTQASQELETATETLKADPRGMVTPTMFRQVASTLGESARQVRAAAASTEEVEDRQRVEQAADGLAELERKFEAAGRSADTSPLTADETNARGVPTMLMVVGGIFLAVSLGVYGFVVWRHSSETPLQFRKRLHAMLQPVVALGAIALGICLVVSPGMAEEMVTWGAGIAGSGIGYWIGSAVK